MLESLLFAVFYVLALAVPFASMHSFCLCKKKKPAVPGPAGGAKPGAPGAAPAAGAAAPGAPAPTDASKPAAAAPAKPDEKKPGDEKKADEKKSDNKNDDKKDEAKSKQGEAGGDSKNEAPKEVDAVAPDGGDNYEDVNVGDAA